MTSQKDGPIVGRMVYKGITLWNCDMERIKNMDILDDDVFVCTYPRSGKYNLRIGLLDNKLNSHIFCIKILVLVSAYSTLYQSKTQLFIYE